MPIIYTYPVKSTANDNDLILISDSQDSNKTKQIKISDLPGGSSSGVSSVTATLPVVSSGGSTPVISLKDLTGFGTAGQVIKVNSNADGLEWGAAGSTLPGGSDTQIQYNNGGAFEGTTGLTWDDSTNILSIATRYEGDINGALLQQVLVKEPGGVSKGDVVYISGGTGDNPEVRKAQANSASTMAALGIMKNNTAVDTVGECVTSGEITGLNLTGFTTGDELFVSNTNAGRLLASAPTSEANLIQKIGKVIKGGSGGALTVLGAFRTNATPNLNQGSIFIGDASDQTSTLAIGTNGHVLTSNGTTASWAAAGGSPALPLNSVQFNNNGSFGGSGDFNYNDSTKILTIGDQDQNRGIVNIAGGSSGAGELRLGDPGTSGGTVTLKGGNDHAASYTIKLPDDGPAANNKILESDASGNLTWINTPTGGGISFSGSTADGIATYSSASIANVSSNLTIDNTNKKLNIGSTYSIQDLSGVFKIGSLSSTQAQESIEFHINGAQKVKIDEDGRIVASVGSSANPNLKLGTGSDGIYGTTNTVQLITNGTSKISISDGNTADIQMNDLVEFGSGLRFGATGETLNSYEEGTWTPVMFQSASPSVTATGRYIKIGKKVTAFFTLVCTQGGEAEISNARISGLPFNANSSDGYKAGVSIAQNTANASNQKFIGGAPGGATTIDLKIFTSGTDYQYNQGRWPNSQGNFTVSGSYTYYAQS